MCALRRASAPAPRSADCFDIYDLNNDGYIVREEMFLLLKQTMVKSVAEEDRDEGIKDLVDLVLKKMDHDHDGRISLPDFEASVKADPLLLEAFGQCLPQHKHVAAFLKPATVEKYLK